LRPLNKNSKKDSYALPRVEELLDCLSGNRFFSVIDMKSGDHQVEIFEDFFIGFSKDNYIINKYAANI
jgi:hypothetical protein